MCTREEEEMRPKWRWMDLREEALLGEDTEEAQDQVLGGTNLTRQHRKGGKYAND